MIAIDSHHSSKPSEEEEEEEQEDEEIEEEDLANDDDETDVEQGDFEDRSTSTEGEEEDDRERHDAFEHLKSHPSLTPTPPTDDDQPTSSAETVLHRLKGTEEVSPSNSQQAATSNQSLSGRERESSSVCLEGNVEEEIEESGPALIIAKSIDEPDEDASDQLRETIRADLDEYNPDSEYLSDPDFHDERPGRDVNKVSSTQTEQVKECERLRDRLQRQTKVSEEEVKEDSEIDEATDSAESLETNEEDDNESLTSDEASVTIEPVESLNELEQERDVVESPAELALIDEVDVEFENQEELSENDEEELETVFNIKLPCELRNEKTIDQEQVNEITLDLSEHLVEANVHVEKRRESIAIQQAEGDNSTGEREVPILSSESFEENQADEISDNQITASEAQAELFVDESTLAEDLLTSLRCSIATDKRHSEVTSVLDETENVSKKEYYNGGDEDSTRADDIATEETTPVMYQTTKLGNLGHQNCKQYSLDDIEEDILDSNSHDNNNNNNYSELVDEIFTSNRRRMSQQTSAKILHERGAQSTDKMLLAEQVSNYCDTLVDSITNEAVVKVDFISAEATGLVELSLSKALELSASIPERTVLSSSSNDVSEARRASQRRLYTSSMYYDDKQNSFPTIEQQLERSRSIAKQLEVGLALKQSVEAGNLDITSKQVMACDPSWRSGDKSSTGGAIREVRKRQHKAERASFMFGRRRELTDKFTLESSGLEDESSFEVSADLSQCSLPPRCNQVQHKMQRRRASLEPSNLTCRNAIILNSKNQSARKVRERRRLSQGDLISSISDNELAALTDTEYEAPRVRRRAQPSRATTTPFRERTSRHVEVSHSETNDSGSWNQSSLAGEEEATEPARSSSLKPFLDSSTLKDIERLRNWQPYEEFNEHNSVSPEVCLKIVQDLRSCGSVGGKGARAGAGETTSCTGDSALTGLDSATKCKGAQLFERRQLQSSDWIVEDKSYAEKEEETQLDLAEASENSIGNKAAEPPVKQQQQQVHHARPSLSGETLLITDEGRLSQLVELVPTVVTSHSQPQLEVATVTRTPSFSASSWRVIECDSPDLLTPCDDDNDEEVDADANGDEDEDECDLSESETIGNDDDDDGMVGPDEDAHGLMDLPGYKLPPINGSLADVLVSGKTKQALQSRIEVQRVTQSSYSEVDQEEPEQVTPVPEVGEQEQALDCYDDATSLKPINVVAHIKPAERASEIHHASLVEWRPQVMTPTRMMPANEDSSIEKEERAITGYSFACESIQQPASVVENNQAISEPTNHRRRCSSLTHEQSFFTAGRRYDNLHRPTETADTISNPSYPSSRISTLRGNYQSLIDEAHYKSSRYRSYHYPFASRDRVRPPATYRSSSLMRDPTASFSAPCSPPPLPLRTDSTRVDWQKYYLTTEQAEPKQMVTPGQVTVKFTDRDSTSWNSNLSQPGHTNLAHCSTSCLPVGRICQSCGSVRLPTRLSSFISSQSSLSAVASGRPQPLSMIEEKHKLSLSNSGNRSELCCYLSHARDPHRCEQARRDSLQVCIKSPRKVHKIIICRIPEVTFATIVHQH